MQRDFKPNPDRRAMTHLRQGLLSVSLVVALGLVLGGCDNLSSLVDNGPKAAPAAAPARPETQFQAGDKIKIVVIDEDRITGEYEVDANGAISLPLAGTLRAAGETKIELETLIRRKLQETQILRDPMVTVDISTLRPFYVMGEVEKPGEYPYRTGLNVMSAVAVAGGDTYRASHSSAQIQRAGEQSFTNVPFSPDVPIYPGDLVNIPERYF
jgi:polysaccharide export outer membrane protein